MTILSVAALVLAVGAAVALVLMATGRQSPGPLVRSRVRSAVVVTLKSGASFQGVLYAADRRAWVLKSAIGLGQGDRGENVQVDGELLLFVADIDFAQKP